MKDTSSNTDSSSRLPTLVIGAKGKTGHRLAARLEAAGHPVLRASRSGERRFDWNDRGTWETALENVEAIYLTYHPDLAFPGAAETVGTFADLAVKQGVRRLALLSGRGEEGARAAEQRIRNSGAEWTIVRCAFFNQNFSETFADAVRYGVLAMPAGSTAEPFVDAEDIADVAYAALTEDGHNGQIYELTGPRLLTFADAASELGEAIGREVRYVPVTPEEYAADLATHGFPADFAAPIANLIAEVLDGRNSYLTDGVQRALGRAPRDFREYAREAAAAGVWEPVAVAA